jgi:starch phosphorylase
MSKQTPVSKPIYSLLPTDVEGFDSLAELALDMRWSWNHAADEVWRELDPAQWDLTHNPWGVLETVSRDRMERVLADPAFRKKVDALVQAKRQAAKAPAWFQQTYSKSRLASTGSRWKIMWARGQAEQRLLPDWVRARVIQAKRRTKL